MNPKYKFTDPDTQEVTEIAPERWVWGVVYRPTEAQLERSVIETERRNKVLQEELEERLAKMKANNASEKDIEILKGEYELTMDKPAGLERDELHQFGDDGIFHRVGEIDQDRIEVASLYFYDDYSMKKRIDIPFRPGMKLVHKYRNIRPAGYKDFIKIYMFGFKYEGTHCLFFVLPDDRIVISPDDQVDLTNWDLINK